MDEIQSLMHGFGVALSLKNIALMFTGVILGVIIGVLPGLGGANGVAILLPLTFGMAQTPGGATSAIILLSCIYWGALFGGAITSILFNIPGEPWSVATTFDGYPLAQQGRAGDGAHRGVHLVVHRRARRGDRDHLPVAGGRRTSRSSSGRRSSSRSTCSPSAPSSARARSRRSRRIAAMMLGFALAAVGTDPVTGTLRLTFGSTHLLTGFDFLVAVIGLFGIGEILLTLEEGLAFRGAQGEDQPAAWCSRPGRSCRATG